ncbi:hypothetical protein Tco_0102822, partial [Tanacetum coccineum]
MKKSIYEKQVAEATTEERTSWMTPIMEYLVSGILPADKKLARKIRVKAPNYRIIDGILYKRSFLTPWLRCVGPKQAKNMIKEIHTGSCGLHAGPRSLVEKITTLGYYWPSMQRDSTEAIQSCNACQIHSPKYGSGDWNSLKFQDTANSGQKKETKAMVFHQMETEEVNDRFVAPCFVNGLEAYDGEINLGVVKKELIVALRGEIYFVKFIINQEEDDVELGVIFSRSFLRMTKAITDFGAGTIIIYPGIDPFMKETKEQEKSNDDWDNLLDFNLDDVPLLEEAAKEELAIRMSRKFALQEEERPIIEIMAYHDKYKKILDEVWKVVLNIKKRTKT